MCRILENYKCLKSSWLSCINLWWLNTFTNFTFSKNHTLRKVDVLPFLTVSSSLSLLIVCKFDEWERFAQFLVGKPILPKLHILIGSVTLYRRKIWTSFSCLVLLKCYQVIFSQFKFPANLAQLVLPKMHCLYANAVVQPSV